MRGFDIIIHNHPIMEKEKGIDSDHVIVDRRDFNEARNQEAPSIRVLEPDEILVIGTPNEITKEHAADILKSVSKAKRFILISGYTLYVVKRKEQIAVLEENEIEEDEKVEVLRDSPAGPS